MRAALVGYTILPPSVITEDLFSHKPQPLTYTGGILNTVLEYLALKCQQLAILQVTVSCLSLIIVSINNLMLT
jgi:hypothetical protein